MAIDRLQELQEEQNKVVPLMRALAEIGESDKGWETPEQEAEFNGHCERLDAIDDEKANIKRQIDVAATRAKYEENNDREASSRRTEIQEFRQDKAGVITEEDRLYAFQGGLMRANDYNSKVANAIRPDHTKAMEKVEVITRGGSFEMRGRTTMTLAGAQSWHTRGGRTPAKLMHPETRELTIAADSQTVPEGFVNSLEQSMLAYGGIRQIAQIMTTATGNDLPWPTANDTANTGALLAEATTIGSSVDPAFAQIIFKAYKYSSKPILIAEELLTDSAFNLAVIFGQMLGVRIGRAEAAAYATGSGSSQPQGAVTASGTGDTAASATVFTADEVMNVQGALDPDYEALDSCGWAFNKGVLTSLRQLKDGNGVYMWQPGMTASEPNMLLGKPYAVVQQMPAATSGLKPILYGAWEKFAIRDVASFRFHRLDELYRATDQTGFVAFHRTDSHLLDAGTDPMLALLMA